VALVPIEVEALVVLAARGRLPFEDVNVAAQSAQGSVLSDEGGHVDDPVRAVLLDVFQDDDELDGVAETVTERDEDGHGNLFRNWARSFQTRGFRI